MINQLRMRNVQQIECLINQSHEGPSQGRIAPGGDDIQEADVGALQKGLGSVVAIVDGQLCQMEARGNSDHRQGRGHQDALQHCARNKDLHRPFRVTNAST